MNGDPSDEHGEIERLFHERPRSDEELHERLAGLDRSSARAHLTERLGERGALPRQVSTFVRAFSILGLGRDDLPGLSGIVLNPKAPISGRAVSLALVRSVDGARAQELARSVSSAELIAMNDAQLLVVIAAMPQTPERLREITEKIARQPPESQLARFEQIDELRKRLGVPAALLYSHTLGRLDLKLGDAVVDRVLEEGGAAAAWLCESLFYSADRKLARDRWADVSARLYRSPRRAPVDGLCVQAFTGDEDPELRAWVLSIESPVDRSLTLVRVTSTPGELGPCEVLTLADGRDLDRFLNAYPAVSRSPSPLSSLRPLEEQTRHARPPAPTTTPTFMAVCYVSMAVGL